MTLDPDGARQPGPAAHLGRWPRGRARCRRRSRRCWSAPRWPASEDDFRPLAFCAALVGSVFIQIGTNLSNDYSDARRGADTEERLGPVRVTAGGLVPPRKVLVATWLAFGDRGRGRRVPDRARRLGAARDRRRLDPRRRALHGRAAPLRLRGARRAVRVPFFGARGGGRLLLRADRGADARWRSRWRVPVGLLAAAILMVNNIRDIDTDRRAGKRTLAVRLGRERARRLFTATLGARLRWTSAIAVTRRGRAVAAAAAARRAARVPPLARTVATRTDGPSLNARAGAAPACCWPSSRCCCRPGLLLSCDEDRARSRSSPTRCRSGSRT